MDHRQATPNNIPVRLASSYPRTSHRTRQGYLGEAHCTIERNATTSLLAEVNIRRLTVETQADGLEFVLQDLTMAVAGFTTSIQNHQDHIG